MSTFINQIDSLKTKWINLLGLFGVSLADTLAIFADLMARYREPHRHYHNLEHIADVLRVARSLMNDNSRRDAIELAVWFHDAIYHPKAKDNEERSARLLIDTLSKVGVSQEVLDAAAAMVRATTHFELSEVDADTAILLDADLAILAADKERYEQYAKAIRQEYAWVEETAYQTGRSAVLGLFLKRERIYHSERAFGVWEEPARKNLTRELELLATAPGERIEDSFA